MLFLYACAAPPPPPTPVPAAPAPAPEPPAPVEAAPPPAPWTGQRIVAIGDLHGDLDNAIRLLDLLDVTDASGSWAGGDTVLVQTGDVMDRGADSHDLLELLRRLTAEAAAAGGQVISLLGNHEVMNLRGDWRYVTPEDLARYGGEEARKAALARGGADGDWLRARDATARVGDTVFVHGGITPPYATGGVDAINTKIHQVIDAPGKPPILGEDGPLWYRGYVNDPEEQACPQLDEALRRLSARRMVVGHTTRRDGKVEPRCGGKLLVIDTGIADHYGGHLAGIELLAGTDARVRYVTAQDDLPDPAP